jgi:hypothetical protein
VYEPDWLGVAGSVVPPVGETLDYLVIADPKSSSFEVGAAGVSLLLNQLTGGLLPNFGAVLKGGVGTADPSLIRFSQNNAGEFFKDGRSVDALVAGLKHGTIRPGDAHQYESLNRTVNGSHWIIGVWQLFARLELTFLTGWRRTMRSAMLVSAASSQRQMEEPQLQSDGEDSKA